MEPAPAGSGSRGTGGGSRRRRRRPSQAHNPAWEILGRSSSDEEEGTPWQRKGGRRGSRSPAAHPPPLMRLCSTPLTLPLYLQARGAPAAAAARRPTACRTRLAQTACLTRPRTARRPPLPRRSGPRCSRRRCASRQTSRRPGGSWAAAAAARRPWAGRTPTRSAPCRRQVRAHGAWGSAFAALVPWELLWKLHMLMLLCLTLC